MMRFRGGGSRMFLMLSLRLGLRMGVLRVVRYRLRVFERGRG